MAQPTGTSAITSCDLPADMLSWWHKRRKSKSWRSSSHFLEDSVEVVSLTWQERWQERRVQQRADVRSVQLRGIEYAMEQIFDSSWKMRAFEHAVEQVTDKINNFNVFSPDAPANRSSLVFPAAKSRATMRASTTGASSVHLCTIHSCVDQVHTWDPTAGHQRIHNRLLPSHFFLRAAQESASVAVFSIVSPSWPKSLSAPCNCTGQTRCPWPTNS